MDYPGRCPLYCTEPPSLLNRSTVLPDTMCKWDILIQTQYADLPLTQTNLTSTEVTLTNDVMCLLFVYKYDYCPYAAISKEV